MTTTKATEEQFNLLHEAVTTELTNRLNKGEDCSTADIKAAIDWLAKNNITGVSVSNSPLGKLLEALKVEQEDVDRVVS